MSENKYADCSGITICLLGFRVAVSMQRNHVWKGWRGIKYARGARYRVVSLDFEVVS